MDGKIKMWKKPQFVTDSFAGRGKNPLCSQFAQIPADKPENCLPTLQIPVCNWFPLCSAQFPVCCGSFPVHHWFPVCCPFPVCCCSFRFNLWFPVCCSFPVCCCSFCSPLVLRLQCPAPSVLPVPSLQLVPSPPSLVCSWLPQVAKPSLQPVPSLQWPVHCSFPVHHWFPVYNPPPTLPAQKKPPQ